MTDIAAIIGAISGVISLLGVIYGFGVWKGRMQTRVERLERDYQEYPPAEIAMMAKTLWEIYVVDALRSRPDLVEHSSSFRLKKEGEALIPDHLKNMLDSMPHNPTAAKGWEVVKTMGMEPISQMAEEKGLTVQQAIAILTAYLENRNGIRGC